MKLPIRSLGLVAAGLLLATALAPVAAQQQQSGVDGQVAVRSDGAVYLISGGQRRWVATVVISDDEINAYPEGEPIFAGLAPMGSAQAAAKPSSSQPAANTQQQPQSGGGASAKPTNTPAPQPTADPNLSADIPVEVDIDGSAKMERGEERRVDIKTRKDVTCELTVRLPGGKEFSEDSKNADNQGKCRFTIEIPSDADEGEGFMIGTAREGGKVNKSQLSFEVVKKK